MRSMNRVARLKADHPLPAFLRKEGSQFLRLVVVSGEGTTVGWLYQVYLAAEQHISLPVKGCHARVFLIGGAVDFASFPLLVIPVELPHEHGSHRLTVTVNQGHHRIFLERIGHLFFYRKGYGHT